MDFDAVHTNAGEAGDNAHHANVASAVKRQAGATDTGCLRDRGSIATGCPWLELRRTCAADAGRRKATGRTRAANAWGGQRRVNQRGGPVAWILGERHRTGDDQAQCQHGKEEPGDKLQSQCVHTGSQGSRGIAVGWLGVEIDAKGHALALFHWRRVGALQRHGILVECQQGIHAKALCLLGQVGDGS